LTKSPAVAALSFLVWDVLITHDQEVDAILSSVSFSHLASHSLIPPSEGPMRRTPNGSSSSSAILQSPCKRTS
jgi:hypothetical protein